MTFRTLLAATAATLTFAGAAQAATIGAITEGTRALVEGTTAVVDPGSTRPIDLGTVTATESAEVYGVIAPGSDVYTFSSAVDFTVDWIFGGYNFDNGLGGLTNTAVSGLRQGPAVTIPPADKMVNFMLNDNAGGGSVEVGNALFTAEVISGPSNLFGQTFSAGDYTLNITGQGTARLGLYDISVAAAAPIPVPASALLLLGAMGGLGFAARRRKG